MNSEFPNTRLSVIERIQQGSDVERLNALHTFIDTYRPALVSFLTRCKGVAESDAEDLVHDFILNKIMNGKLLDGASDNGRFRNLLRVSLQRYLIDSIRKQKREKIDGNKDLEDVQLELAVENDQIDQVWAEAVFAAALGSLKHQSPYWDLFVDRVLTQPPVPYDQIIEKHNYSSPEKASNCLITAKRHFNRLIEQCVVEQSHWTDGHSEEELRADVELLKSLLNNSNLIREILDGLKLDAIQSMSVSQMDHSILGEQAVFVDDSVNEVWGDHDIPMVLDHLLDQKMADFGGVGQRQLKELLFNADATEREGLIRVKEYFNKRGKTGKSLMPEKVDVTMTFAAISAFVCYGGQTSEITSMQPNILADRIDKLRGKPWLPSRLKRLFDETIAELLS